MIKREHVKTTNLRIKGDADGSECGFEFLDLASTYSTQPITTFRIYEPFRTPPAISRSEMTSSMSLSLTRGNAVSQIKNIAASVRARLMNISKNDNRPFGEVLQYYAMERFLYRLSLSKHSKRFVLKGALMLRVWDFPNIRPTMDIDMLGITDNEEQKLLHQIMDILQAKVEQKQWNAFCKRLKQKHIPENFLNITKTYSTNKRWCNNGSGTVTEQ